jgi:hypothetical protein
MHMEIPKGKELENRVFSISNEKEFTIIALEVYRFQYYNNPLYRHYCEAVRKMPPHVKETKDIPFLPISFFKSHRVETTTFDPELVFKSSGTTASVTSSHYVKSSAVYEKSFSEGFKGFYGDIRKYCILGLLPSYLERGNSSLVYMVDYLSKASGHDRSGFYLNDFERLNDTLKELESSGQKTILIGVTYALLDFGHRFRQQLNNTILMETGGMKGRGKEMTKTELNLHLTQAFGVSEIHSEYGMTELLSQAYGVNGNLRCPPWMRLILRDETDPFALFESRGTGVINVIDLANVYSCSFIATDDMGKFDANGSFEVLGRIDNSDVRGCSLMVV